MAKTETVTQQAIFEACQTLIDAGSTPTVRKIADKIGGSYSKLSQGLREWRDQQVLANAATSEVSNELKQALLAEFSRITQSLKENLHLQLQEKDQQLKENLSILQEYETKIEALTTHIQSLKTQARETQLHFEKQLAAAAAKLDESTKRTANLEQQLNKMREEKHQADIRAAVFETQVKEYQIRLKEIAK